jgi:nucleotide-binding universal stress UspA family protein
MIGMKVASGFLQPAENWQQSRSAPWMRVPCRERVLNQVLIHSQECAMLPIRTILHPTDFSAHSDYAFRLACALARDYGAGLIVLHVLERPVFTYAGVMTAPPPPPPSAEDRQALQEQLQRIKPRDTAIRVEYLLEEGDPATAIVQVAQERPCDLIMMGSHGRTGLQRLLMGSVAEQVVRKASCPVLTVKTPQHPVPSAEQPTVAAGKEAGATQ